MPTIARLQLAVSTTGAAKAHAELESLDNALNRLDQVWRNRVARFVTDRDKEGGALNRVTLIAEQANIRQSRAVERTTERHRRFGGVLGALVQQMVRMSSRAVLMASVFGGLAVVAYQLGAALAPVVGLAGALPGLLIAGGVAGITAKLAFSGMGDALKAMAEAQDGSEASLKKLREAMNGLPPAARPVVRQLFEMRTMVTRLRETAAAGVMPGLAVLLRSLGGLFPMVRRVIADTSQELGGLAERVARLTRLQTFRRDLAAVLGDAGRLTRNFGNAGIYLTQALVKVAAVARPLVLSIGALAERAGFAAQHFVDNARQSGAMARFFERAGNTAELLGNMLADIVTILFNLGRVAAPAGQGLLEMLAGVLDRAARASRNLDNLRRTILAVADAAIILKAALLGAAFGPWGLAAGAVVGVLAVLYRRSAEFREIVELIGYTIARTVMPAFRDLVGWVQGQFLPALRLTIPFVRDQLGQAFANVSKAIRDNRAEFLLVGRIIVTVAGWILTRLIPVLIRVAAVVLRLVSDELGSTIRMFGWFVRTIQNVIGWVQTIGRAIGDYVGLVKRNWDRFTALTRSAWNLFRVVIADNINRVRQEIFKAIVGLIPGYIRTGWGSANRASSDALNRFRTMVADSFRRARQMVSDWGRAILLIIRNLAGPLLSAGRTIWSALVNGIRSIDLVGAIRGLLNRGIGLLNAFGSGVARIGNVLLPGSPIRFPAVPRLQQGGAVPGRPRGDRVPILAEGGEVMIREPVAGPLRSFLLAVNAMPAATARRLAEEFRRSGPLDMAGDPGRLVLGRGRMRRPDVEGQVFGFQRGGVTPPGGAAEAIRPGVVPLIHRAQQWARAQDPKPYVWGAVGPGGFDCSGIAGNLWALLTGNPLYRRYFTTGTVGGFDALRPGLGAFSIGVTSGSGHMAANVGGLGVEARSSRSGIIVGGGARDVRSFPRQYYLPQVGGRFVAGGLFTAAIQRMLDAVLGPIRRGLAGMGGPENIIGQVAGALARKMVDTVARDFFSLGGVSGQWGGLISEPVSGFGLHTGRRYAFGERGAIERYRGPGDAGMGGAVVYNFNVSLTGTYAEPITMADVHGAISTAVGMLRGARARAGGMGRT
jgi:hypothetical protein